MRLGLYVGSTIARVSLTRFSAYEQPINVADFRSGFHAGRERFRGTRFRVKGRVSLEP